MCVTNLLWWCVVGEQGWRWRCRSVRWSGLCSGIAVVETPSLSGQRSLGLQAAVTLHQLSNTPNFLCQKQNTNRSPAPHFSTPIIHLAAALPYYSHCPHWPKYLTTVWDDDGCFSHFCIKSHDVGSNCKRLINMNTLHFLLGVSLHTIGYVSHDLPVTLWIFRTETLCPKITSITVGETYMDSQKSDTNVEVNNYL